MDVGLGRVGGVGRWGGGGVGGFFPIVLEKNHVWSWGGGGGGGGIGGWVAGRMWDWEKMLYAFGFGGLGWRQNVIFCVRVGELGGSIF